VQIAQSVALDRRFERRLVLMVRGFGDGEVFYTNGSCQEGGLATLLATFHPFLSFEFG
jgi:hypothetical protein